VVDGPHTLIRNRTKKPLAIALSGVGRALMGRDIGGNVTNVQYKPNWNCRYESPCTMNIFLIEKEKK
jgi:hypothetical protein